MPAMEMTATSVVPPPMSTTMLPVGSVMGRPAPIAATIACSTRIHLGGLGPIRRIADGALLHLRDLARDADDDARAHPDLPVVRLLDEVVEHALGVLEVGDDAVLHRPDRDDVAGRAAEHLLGFLADGLDLAGLLVHGDDRRLADDDSLALAEHQGVRRAEVDGKVVGEQGEDRLGSPGHSRLAFAARNPSWADPTRRLGDAPWGSNRFSSVS